MKANTPLLLFIVLMLSACHYKQPKSSAKGMSSFDSAFFYTIVDSVNYLYENHDFKTGKHILDSLSLKVDSSSCYKTKANYLSLRALYYEFLNNEDSARYYYQLDFKWAKEKDSTHKAEQSIKLEESYFYNKLKKLDTAILLAQEVCTFAKEHKDTFLYSHACDQLSSAYYEVGNVELYRKYLFESFRFFADSDLRELNIRNIGEYYLGQNYIDSAFNFYNQYILPDTLNMPAAAYSETLINYAHVLNRKGDTLGEINYFKRALNMEKAHNIFDYQSYFNMALTYYDAKKYRLSKTYLDTSLMYFTIKEDDGAQTKKYEILYWISHALLHQGMDKEGYRMFDSAWGAFKNATDSSFKIKATELETKFEVKDKDRAITILNLTNKEANSKAKQQQYLLVALALIIALVIAFVYQNNKRQKLRSANEKLEAERNKIELEQRLLRTQMEPHFIFNSLAVLQAQIHKGEKEKASKYLNQFARLLRACLENSREGFVSLAEEVEALQNYLSLQAMRFENVFDYCVTVYDGYQDDTVYIPPMLLQPFVENAIYHGIKSIAYKGKIDLMIQKENGMLLCTIEDNGLGIEAMQPGENKKSLSTIITQERLAILGYKTGKQASLTICNKALPATGTLAKLILPYSNQSH